MLFNLYKKYIKFIYIITNDSFIISGNLRRILLIIYLFMRKQQELLQFRFNIFKFHILLNTPLYTFLIILLSYILCQKIVYAEETSIQEEGKESYSMFGNWKIAEYLLSKPNPKPSSTPLQNTDVRYPESIQKLASLLVHEPFAGNESTQTMGLEQPTLFQTTEATEPLSIAQGDIPPLPLMPTVPLTNPEPQSFLIAQSDIPLLPLTPTSLVTNPPMTTTPNIVSSTVTEQLNNTPNLTSFDTSCGSTVVTLTNQIDDGYSTQIMNEVWAGELDIFCGDIMIPHLTITLPLPYAQPASQMDPLDTAIVLTPHQPKPELPIARSDDHPLLPELPVVTSLPDYTTMKVMQTLAILKPKEAQQQAEHFFNEFIPSFDQGGTGASNQVARLTGALGYLRNNIPYHALSLENDTYLNVTPKFVEYLCDHYIHTNKDSYNKNCYSEATFRSVVMIYNLRCSNPVALESLTTPFRNYFIQASFDCAEKYGLGGYTK